MAFAPLACSIVTPLDGLTGGSGGAALGDDGTPDAGDPRDAGAGADTSAPPRGVDASPPSRDAGGGGTSDAGTDTGPGSTCTPTPLACDGKVHACDGVVDEGCPASISTNAPGPSQFLGGTATDFTPFDDTCPTGQVLIGVGGATGQWIDALWGVCGQLEVQASSTSVKITAGQTLPTRGTVGGDVTWSSMCPPNQAVVGIAGNCGRGMDNLVLTCAPLVITGPVGALTLHLGADTAMPSVGDVGGGGPFAPVHCSGPAVLTSISGSAGQWLASMGVACATPTLTMR